MGVRQLPQVDERRCTGTGDCVAVCPTACLASAAGIPYLARPHECASCALCVAVCPVEAIRLEDQWDARF